MKKYRVDDIPREDGRMPNEKIPQGLVYQVQELLDLGPHNKMSRLVLPWKAICQKKVQEAMPMLDIKGASGRCLRCPFPPFLRTPLIERVASSPDCGPVRSERAVKAERLWFNKAFVKLRFRSAG